MSTSSPVARLRRGLAVLVLLALAGCGGGIAELFAKLITARFVPAQATLAPGASLDVELEVTCDNAALGSFPARLGVLVRLDPGRTLAGGVGATLVPPPPSLFGPVLPDTEGFLRYECSTPTASPDLRIAHIPVVVAIAAGTPPLSTTLTADLKVEPIDFGEPSKDSTTADLSLRVGAAAPPSLGGNLLINRAFDESVGVGGLPVAPANWRGDPGRIVGTDQGIAPRSAATMLRFDGSATTPGASSGSSRQWQVVDLAPFRDAVASGTVSAHLAAFFNRIGGENVDSRFELRLFAYDGAMTDLPTRYAQGTHLATQTTPLQANASQWQEAVASLALPGPTTYLLVEIRALEGFSEVASFAGNYVDDASLTLSATPSAGVRP